MARNITISDKVMCLEASSRILGLNCQDGDRVILTNARLGDFPLRTFSSVREMFVTDLEDYLDRSNGDIVFDVSDYDVLTRSITVTATKRKDDPQTSVWKFPSRFSDDDPDEIDN